MIVSGDFETHWDNEYSLSKMSEVDYILDPRFEAIMLALKVGSKPSEVLVGRAAIAARLATLPWGEVAWLSHNTRFDGAILAWRFGHIPRFYLDTLSMARATTHWVVGSSSLAKISEYLELPAKGSEVYKAKGKHLVDFDPYELNSYARYCIRDNENCFEIFNEFKHVIPQSELRIIDLVLRMFILPQVKLNPAVLELVVQQVKRDKELALGRVGHIPKKVLSSNQQFAELLKQYNVTVPMKISPSTGEMIPALAKGDWEFKELCVDDTQLPEVQLILQARLAAKSTLEETRSQNLLKLSTTDWPRGLGDRWAPVPLKYSGARTHRLSGDGGTNWQNLPRGSLLREAVEAPPGYRIVHRDAAQIEARMVAWLASCTKLVEAFQEGKDVYCEFAYHIFDRVITPEHKLERFIGKTAILGLGYACGPVRFRHMLFIGSGGMSASVTLERAQEIVYLYRDTYPEIPALWTYTNRMLSEIQRGPSRNRRVPILYQHIPIVPDHQSFMLPNKLKICYPNLRYEEKEVNGMTSEQLVYDDPATKSVRHIYGAKGVENISQALARLVITDAALQVYDATGFRPFLSTHDSLDYCVPVSEADGLYALLGTAFSTPPPWAEGLPLASQGGWGVNLRAAENGDNK